MVDCKLKCCVSIVFVCMKNLNVMCIFVCVCDGGVMFVGLVIDMV